ncbi:unnamed protein product [Boreogadus saida]
MAASNGNGDKVSKFETLKLLEKCRKERDDALHRESILREKLRQFESRSRSTEAIKQKIKSLTNDNKELRKQTKSLRAEIGLEASPKFSGKTTKDIVNDFHEKERQCNSLIEKAGKLSLTIDDLTSELANTVTSKTLLEDQRPGPVINKGVQTEMSINLSQKLPVNAFETKPFRRDSEKRSMLDKHSLATLTLGNPHDKKAFVHDEIKGLQH